MGTDRSAVDAHVAERTLKLRRNRSAPGVNWAIYDLVLAALSENELASRNRVIGALRSRGAVSPATARSVADLDVATGETWRRLVIEGRVREGPPGQFYLFEPPRPSARERLVKLVVFYALIVLIPIMLILASRNGH